MILDLLVRRDPADEQEVHEAVVQDLFERRPSGRLRDPRGIDRNREHAGAAEAERLELRPVVLRIAERQVDAAGERRELVPPERREPEQRRIVRREIRRRRHVVVLQDASGRRARRTRSVIGDGSA